MSTWGGLAAWVLEVKNRGHHTRVLILFGSRRNGSGCPWQFASPNAREDLVEFLFTDQERVMLDDEFLVRFEEIERLLHFSPSARRGTVRRAPARASPRISAMNSAATRLSRA